MLKDFEKPYVLASGEVTRPGKYELRGDLTVSEAVAMAGGLTHEARHTQVDSVPPDLRRYGGIARDRFEEDAGLARCP